MEESGAQEKQISQAVQKAFKRLLKNIKSEPALVIEGSSEGADLETPAVRDVQTWLFRRRQDGGRAGD